MRHTTFGRRTGLRVSEYALGTANFGTGPAAPTRPEEARAIFDAFLEAGGTFIDRRPAHRRATGGVPRRARPHPDRPAA